MHLQENTHASRLPKSSKNQSNSTGNLREIHAKEKADKPRQPKRNSKHSTPNDTLNESNLTARELPLPMDKDSLQHRETTDDNLPPKIQTDNPKRTNYKKTKDVQGVSGSSKSRLKSQLKEHNSNEDMHSISNDQISKEDVNSRTISKSREHKGKEGSHLRSNLKSRDSNLNERRSSRPKTKHRLNEEDREFETESDNDILSNCPN